MHFSTSMGSFGSFATLESRLFYPKRAYQCLEFFYYHSGSESDQLQIWINEYTPDYPNGILKLVDSVSGKKKNNFFFVLSTYCVTVFISPYRLLALLITSNENLSSCIVQTESSYIYIIMLAPGPGNNLPSFSLWSQTLSMIFTELPDDL